MSDPAAVAPGGGSLQFDRAERAAAPAETTCAVCHQPVGATYYVVAYAGYRATGVGVWGAIAHFGAWVNLFNLLPVWQLDGARGFRALTRQQRWIAVAVIALMWLVTSEGLLLLLGIAAAAAAGFSRAADEPDHTALLQYGFLVSTLSLLTRIAVPAAGP